ncbi:hypothetical protein [Candidatus Sneabacter namystus]|uniref:Uncharacterized protein n=1 Tax=Candidatus Sneabacter namystus TaxID=2601646 RepID=A0A5C0UHY0_9RICK|nr:hypothetical protein [Candidatus Sneabacter namystus]QEK39349.1 hypothetical protein FZC37_00090 [Candidatus Sneabacter namystus]
MGSVAMEVDDNKVIIKNALRTLDEIRSVFAKHRKPGMAFVDDFLKHKRKAALQEMKKFEK